MTIERMKQIEKIIGPTSAIAWVWAIFVGPIIWIALWGGYPKPYPFSGWWILGPAIFGFVGQFIGVALVDKIDEIEPPHGERNITLHVGDPTF